jgi:rhodanese-related sulfurtransferase
MNKFILLAFYVLLLNAAPIITPEVKVLLTKAKSNVESISAKEANNAMLQRNVVFVDVRNPNEWKNGTIKTNNLVKLSRGLLEIKYPKLILSKYKKNDEFIVYCAIEPRSIFASNRLKELGFTNVKYLKKGFRAWNEAGFPTTK